MKGFNPIDIVETYLEKAKQTATTGAMFHTQDLSQIIYLDGIPEHKFLQRLMVDENVNGDPHYWSKMSYTRATGTGSHFDDGDKPSVYSTAPTRTSNNIYQVGRCAEVTDKQLLLFAKAFGGVGGGTWKIHGPGNALQAFQNELELQVKLRFIELVDEIAEILVNGVGSTTLPGTQGLTDVQCDGMFQFLTNNTVDANAAVLDESHIKTLAKAIRDRMTGRFPQYLYVNSTQKGTINNWATNIWFGRNRELEAGKDVSTFNTGYFVVQIDIDDHIPVGSCAMIDHSVWYKMDLSGIMMSELARINTTLGRMMTYYGTLKCGTDLSSGQIFDLAA